MFEIVFPLYLIVVSLCVFSYLQHHALSASIRKVAEDIEARLNGDVSVPESFLTELKDEMGDLVHETIQNLQPPNAADHVMGAIAQMIQMRAMQKFGMVEPRLNAPVETEQNENV